jgi:hypothetical protein
MVRTLTVPLVCVVNWLSTYFYLYKISPFVYQLLYIFFDSFIYTCRYIVIIYKKNWPNTKALLAMHYTRPCSHLITLVSPLVMTFYCIRHVAFYDCSLKVHSNNVRGASSFYFYYTSFRSKKFFLYVCPLCIKEALSDIVATCF